MKQSKYADPNIKNLIHPIRACYCLVRVIERNKAKRKERVNEGDYESEL